MGLFVLNQDGFDCLQIFQIVSPENFIKEIIKISSTIFVVGESLCMQFFQVRHPGEIVLKDLRQGSIFWRFFFGEFFKEDLFNLFIIGESAHAPVKIIIELLISDPFHHLAA